MPAFRSYRRLALRPVALAATLVAAPAWAQEAAAPANQLETVTVTGIRASLESALNAKRQDKGIVDVIKAEDMGKFPDTNLAESLQRIPGVVIDRDAGEGRNITVRGLGGDFTRTRINGIEALATTGGTDSSGGANRTRAFDFNVFAADLFNSLTVRKSSSADVDEGSLGATIDLQTARPFDMKNFAAAVSVKSTYNDLSGKATPKAAFLISNTFADKKIGVLLSGAYSQRKVYEEGFSTVRWDNGPSSGGWCSPTGVTPINPANPTTTPATPATSCGGAATTATRLPNTPENIAAYNTASLATNFHPRLPRYGRLTHDQSRLGLTGSIQVRPSDTTLITADMLYSKLDATRQEDFLEAISFSRNLSQGGKQQTSVLAAEYNAAGQMVYGKFNGVDIRSESRFDKLSTEFTQPTLTIEQDIGDTLKATVRIGTAKSRFNNPIQTTTTLDAPNVDGYVFDARGDDRAPLLSYGTLNPADPNGALQIRGVPVGSSSIANFTPSEVRIRPNGVTNKQDVATFDLAWDPMDGLTVRGGVSYKRFSFTSYDFRRTVETMNTLPANALPGGLVTTLSGFGKGQNLPAGSVTSWVIPNLDAIAAAYDIYCNCLKTGAAGGPGDYRLTSITNGNARGGNRAITETDTGAWLMAEYETKLGGLPVRGNAGLRHVKTAIVANGYLATGGGSLVTASRQYNDWLPSANVAVNLAKDLIVRAAAAKVMSRPPLQSLNPGGTLSTTGTLTYTGGNPQLDPFRATTLDASVEWYHSKNAFVGLGVFQKDIKSYVLTKGFDAPYKDSGLPLSLLPSNFTGDEVFRFSAPVNTQGGKLTGFEINVQQPFTFLPGWGKNFGLLANYTQVKSKMEYVLSTTAVGSSTVTEDLVNLSPRSWNLSVYYDDGTFSGRVSSSSRSAFLTAVPAGNNQDVAGKNKTFNVDLSMGYKINKQLEVTFEATNLTNQPNDQFISRAMDNVVVNNYTGREFIIGGRYKF